MVGEQAEVRMGERVEVRPFTVSVGDEVLDDLRLRLARTRWLPRLPVPDWQAGVDPLYLAELVRYWEEGFDWHAREEYLNGFPQFVAAIDGMEIHFVHLRGNGPAPFPVVLTHGWPSCFADLLTLGAVLADPGAHGGDAADAFDVVIPSLPGYGFSSCPPEPRFAEPGMVAGIWRRLMTDGLGYHRFGAHGWDIGAGITTRLGAWHADAVAGIHVPGLWSKPAEGPPLTAAERDFVARRDQWQANEAGYALEQATKPLTLAAALADSPAGLAAWLVEKHAAWSDCGGDIERAFSKDQLLTTLMIYWVSGTIGSSFLPYYQGRHHPGPPLRPVGVPTAVAVFPADLPSPPREWVERTCRVVQWTEMPRGGHFPAAEEPGLLAADLRTFFGPLRRQDSW
jgi:pimeloyl-ACP methyl ester carboxylesterase